MAELMVRWGELQSLSQATAEWGAKVQSVGGEAAGIANKIYIQSESVSQVKQYIRKVSGELEELGGKIADYGAKGEAIAGIYEKAEKKAVLAMGGTGTAWKIRPSNIIWTQPKPSPNYWDMKSLIQKLIGKAGFAGIGISAAWAMADSSFGGKDWAKLLGNFAKMAEKGVDIKWKELLNKDVDQWKKLFGLNKGSENLTGAAGFKSKWADAFDDFGNPKSAKGAAKWAGTIFSGIVNAFTNYQEYADGEISAGRAVMETIGETAADIVIGAAVGAAVAAVIGTAAPAVVAGGISVAVVWASDCLVKWATNGEKDGLSELISDTVLDVGEYVGERISNAAQNIANAVGEGAKSIGNGVKSIWKGITTTFRNPQLSPA